MAKVRVEYRVQLIAGERDITGDFYADADADCVRFWEEDGFCLLEMSYEEEGWVATGGDGDWTSLGELPFTSPMAALLAAFPAESYELVEVEG